jgi:RNA polymerase sigma-70 factor (ECF subfamily)
MAGISPETFTQILDRQTAALVLYARQWCNTPEDVVQDVFLLLVSEAAAPENPVGWLYRTVRNKAINAARSGRRRARHEAQAAHREPWLLASQGDHLDAEAAAKALAELPIEQREVIVARLWGGLSFAAIADLTGSPLSTTHRWYQQGIAALRERLEGTCPQKKNTCRS